MHSKEDLPVRNAICGKCKTKEHYARVCLRKDLFVPLMHMILEMLLLEQ